MVSTPNPRNAPVLVPVLTAVASIASLVAGCGPPPATPRAETIEQWATGSTSSSNGSTGTDWASIQALGEPDVVDEFGTPICDDNPNAWSPAEANPVPGVSGGDYIDDWLELTYDYYVFVRKVRIYETFAPGAIVAVDLERTDGALPPLPVYENPDGNGEIPGPTPCPSVFKIETTNGPTPDQYNRVVIYIDSNLVGDVNGVNGSEDDYNEIDAVQLIGDILVD